MEERKVKVGFNKGGTGGLSPRMTLPITWLRSMGVTPESREMFIYQLGDDIIVSKQQKDMLELAKQEITYIIKKYGFIYDFTEDDDRLINELASAVLHQRNSKDIDELEEIETELIKFCYDNFKSVSDFSCYAKDKIYFYDKKYNFETIEELEKYFSEVQNESD